MDIRQTRLHTLERHIERLERHIVLFNRRSETLMRWRLGVFLPGVVVTVGMLAFSDLLAIIVGIVWLIGFAMLVRQHRRVTSTIEKFQLWRNIKQEHLARMRLDWSQLPPETVHAPDEHPYAVDLDIVGQYSLHRLLDTTITHGGADRLSEWLLYPVLDAAYIQARQRLVWELLPITMFRDRLTLNAELAKGKQTSSKWESEVLLRWLQADDHTTDIDLPIVLVLAGLSVVNITLFLLASVANLPPLWIITAALFILLSGTQWRKLAGLFSEALTLQTQVTRLNAVFKHLETYDYSKRPYLREICAPFTNSTLRPSVQLRRIGRITAAASLQRNVILWALLNLVIPWDITFGYLLARSKGDLAHNLPTWLHALYDLEALNALANFAYLNPAYVFPVIEQHQIISGEQLGHSLIPHEERVCNNFAMPEVGHIVMITGSNMAGKSSFLRTIGVNLVLAYAGSVTVSTQLSAGLMRVYTSVRANDSVVDGFSYFYAEVRRLKGLLDALQTEHEHPVFFLIDEIFRGTNNRERLIGSRSYVRALLAEQGAGLISTHDLELVRIAGESDRISNFHFRERVIDGKMVFDYKLQPGPSPTTNALVIMQMEGLPVDQNEEAYENEHLRHPDTNRQ